MSVSDKTQYDRMQLKQRYGLEWSLLALHLIFFVLLLWVFTTYVVVIYAYMGVFYDSLNINKAIFSILFIMAAFALLRNNGNLSYYYLNFIIASTVAPSLVIFSGSDLPFSFAFITWSAFAIVAVVTKNSKLRPINVGNINGEILSRCFAVVSLIFIVSILAFGGGKFINFDFSLVYDFRQDVASNLPRIYAYLIPTVSKVIIPVGIVISLIHRQRILLIIFTVFNIILFGLSTHKTAILIPPAIIFAYWLAKRPKNANITLLVLIACLVISGVTYHLLNEYAIDDTWIWFGAIFVFRFLLLPSLLNWHHLEFFSTNPKFYWADSKFSLGIISSPYDLPMPFLISWQYVGIERMGSANTGWIGSGMGNAGYFGIILYSVLIGLFLSLIDAYANKYDKSFIFAIFLVPVLTATQSIDLTGMLLTQGLLVLLLIVVFLEPDVKQQGIS